MAVTAISPIVLAAFTVPLALLWFLISPHLSWSRKIAGPWLAKYTRLWYLWQIKKADFHRTNVELHRQRGKIVQVMPGYFSIDDAEAQKIIYGHGTGWIKGEAYDAWYPGANATNLFAERNTVHHAAMRRKVASMYFMTALVSYEPYVDHCIRILESRLADFASSNSTINLARWLQNYAFDVVSKITFGERFGFLDEGHDIGGLINTLDVGVSLHTFLGVYPWLMPWVWRIHHLVSGEEPFHVKFTTDKIGILRSQEEGLSKNGPISMAKKLLTAQKKDGEGFPNSFISSTAGANVGAGSDTTSITLSAIIYYIFRSPRVLQKLRKEIDSAGLTSMPNFHDVQQMPYLQAVIKESLRMHPAVGIPLWREVPKGGAIVCGQFFPEGTNLGVNCWVSHRNQTVYGPDPDVFRPERWLEAIDEDDNNKSREACLMPFGLGSRTCIGKNISLLEINKVIPVLVRDYDFEFVAKDGSAETSGAETSQYLAAKNRWFVKPSYLHARVMRRRGNTTSL